MNKIVCDVCGTSYPDTAAQCPICGNSKTNTAYTGNSATSGAEGYAYVKGGRFSHANVKKINNGQTELPRTVAPVRPAQEAPVYDVPAQENVAPQPEVQQPAYQQPVYQQPVYQEPAPQPAYHERPVREEPPRQPRRRSSAQQRKKERTTNMILMGIVVLLVVAILAVCIFLVTKLLDASKPTVPGPATTTTTPVNPTGTTTVPPYQIPCTGVRLSMPSYAFSSVGEKLLLTVNKQPANTTDPVIFTSSDPRIATVVATVDSDGLVVAVANGTVTITVSCGQFSATCEITCDVGVEPTDPPQTNPTTGPTGTTTKPTEPKVNLELNNSDITMKRQGETHNLYSGELDPGAITWTSSNSAVATVQNGMVTAVANGTATITAEYQGQTKTCIIRVDIPQTEENVEFTLSQYEAMIAVGQSFTLKAYDADGNLIDPSELTFEIEAISEAEGNFFTVDENGVITGVKYNIDWKMKYKTLRVTYKGKTLTCLIFVTNA